MQHLAPQNSALKVSHALRNGSARVTPQQQHQRLARQHQQLKSELQNLERHAYLTPREQDRARTLKKMKLLAKDKLEQLRTGI